MPEDVARREFLKTVSVAAGALAATQCAAPTNDAPAVTSNPSPATNAPPTTPAVPAETRLQPFDFVGVKLLPSRWQQQVAAGRDYYFAVPDADILHGCRKEAGLATNAQPLGGWCGVNSNSIFGQWLSGMARLAHVTGDAPCRQGPRSVRRVGEDGHARRRRAHASLSVRQAGRRPRRPAEVRRRDRGGTDARARGRVCVEDIRSAEAAAGRSDAQPALLRAAAGVVHAVGEPLSRLSSDR